MRYRFLYLVAIFAGMIGTAVAEPSSPELQQIKVRLSVPNKLQCDFRQTRQIAALSRPLESQGTLTLDKTKGVIWAQTAPFAQTVVMTPKRIYQEVQGNSKTISEQEQPQLFHFTALMSDIFQGEWQALQPFFDLQPQPSKSPLWHLDLLPTAQPFNQIFNKISLSGDRTVQHIELDDKQNDTTRLVFSNCHELKQLSHAQQQLLAD
ncbi:outer membrane lipoprotein carrier protein LolA [Testudinibacter sp. TR-2022]|uniref:outer membrane lipoprotein carrier protein LolA n=1 Tax=Testudinibacter sp. TR-2022 TaxID=2585029 RepID=UPI00111879EF|nr:outer membrane lipoprotein carrier protein LolA [Testudinibacter sp. TR-2022]TNH05995.1 outer membrane lipoprotein carrier protein LolA [Pasteurellaceae bacterium Phil11]TNH24304.1 outer membrane lipoprotein carrier protein LolA [Testudinibacter sp. TR-2022]TNH26895.1 outer membrane lipoprotein carrier protein LolA [Testudinibacter sp. TR-2022]